jgi:hypothetical protein
VSESPLPEYTVRLASPLPGLGEGWDHPAWARAATAEAGHFRPESSAHSPRTLVRLLHGRDGIRGVFHIDDQYVRSTRTGYLAQVWKDSCVEFFMQPRVDRGYFNLEMNAGGAHLCYYVEDSARTPAGLKKFTPLPKEDGCQIQVRSSLPETVEPEVREPLGWELNFFIPFAVLEKYVGTLGGISGQSWRGNFYKCGEDLSHPHWASWAPVDELNFHLPRCFGAIHFE